MTGPKTLQHTHTFVVCIFHDPRKLQKHVGGAEFVFKLADVMMDAQLGMYRDVSPFFLRSADVGTDLSLRKTRVVLRRGRHNRNHRHEWEGREGGGFHTNMERCIALRLVKGRGHRPMFARVK